MEQEGIHCSFVAAFKDCYKFSVLLFFLKYHTEVVLFVLPPHFSINAENIYF